MANKNFITAVGVGTAVGLTVGMLISPREHHPRGRTTLGRAVKSFANIVDTIANTVTS